MKILTFAALIGLATTYVLAVAGVILLTASRPTAPAVYAGLLWVGQQGH